MLQMTATYILLLISSIPHYTSLIFMFLNQIQENKTMIRSKESTPYCVLTSINLPNQELIVT